MGKTISRIEPAKPIEVRRKRVAAYARISIITDRLVPIRFPHRSAITAR